MLPDDAGVIDGPDVGVRVAHGLVGAQIEFVAAGFAEPGDTGTVYADVKKPGRYAAVCFIPTGTHGDTEGDGPPHFVQGMVAEFTVDQA